MAGTLHMLSVDEFSIVILFMKASRIHKIYASPQGQLFIVFPERFLAT